MKTIAIVAVLLAAAPAVAKPWQGVEPGQTRREQVIQRFGEPSRVVTAEGKEVIAYFNQQAIKGTKQVQFKVDPGTQLVEQIHVFPGPVIDKESVESTYGNACPSGKAAASGPCYQKKITDDFRTYLHYAKLGLAVFLNEDGRTVHSFIFTPQPAGK
ncbi:hypothetical protein ACN28I_11995 [Archangium gephyra]|uniref:hypothetical protein n=1 Tax=Archangium gephyra TaxID=48 RepID=UPI003B7BBD6E